VLLLVGRALDADVTIRVTCGLALFAIAILHRDARVVLFGIGIDVLHVIGDHLTQNGDLGLKGMHRLGEQVGKQVLVEPLEHVVEMGMIGGIRQSSFLQSRWLKRFFYFAQVLVSVPRACTRLSLASRNYLLPS
jgi:hypothetical protein